MRDLLTDARRRKYAVPNFWGTSMEMLLGQIKAAEEMKAPLSICYCKGLYPEMPLEVGIKLIVTAAEQAKVPVITGLDHSMDINSCVRAMDSGVSAVMYDGSQLPYSENIRNTHAVVEIAHRRGVAVEGELGAVGGSATEWGGEDDLQSVYTDPALVSDFVKQTDVDALAISFGNRHGLYKGKTDLNFDLVRQIRKSTAIPLVMHGASDLQDDVYPKIVVRGISKVHFWSGPSKLATENLRIKLNESETKGEIVGYQDVFKWNVQFFYEITKKYLFLLNAAGKG
jgi:fructose-bisphosphate aldolase class II